MFFDTTKKAITFFSYDGLVIECAKMQVKKGIDQITTDEIKETY